MTAILNVPITTAAANVLSPIFQTRPGPGGQSLPSGALVQANFTWGSGGTSLSAFVQTSLDGGTSWCDVCNFSFTTSSARALFNLTSGTPHAGPLLSRPRTPGWRQNNAVDGVIGNLWRVKFTSVGTYAGGTNLRIDLISDGVTTAQ
jgi:hypothetical protein